MPSTEIHAPVATETPALARHLRAHRIGAGLSLSALALATGLTKGFLSKVERGQGQPSIGTIFRIAEALRVPAAQLLAGDHRQDGAAHLARATDSVPPPTEELHFRPLFPGAPGRLIALEMSPPMEARPAHEPSTHSGEELLHVLSGRMEILFEAESLILETGDSLRFDARRPHRTRSLGPHRARVLVVLTAEAG